MRFWDPILECPIPFNNVLYFLQERPVIAVKSGGPLETIAHNETGALIPSSIKILLNKFLIVWVLYVSL